MTRTASNQAKLNDHPVSKIQLLAFGKGCYLDISLFHLGCSKLWYLQRFIFISTWWKNTKCQPNIFTGEICLTADWKAIPASVWHSS